MLAEGKVWVTMKKLAHQNPHLSCYHFQHQKMVCFADAVAPLRVLGLGLYFSGSALTELHDVQLERSETGGSSLERLRLDLLCQVQGEGMLV